MEFGICFKGDMDPKRTVALARQAEAAGFSYCWTFDSHVLWKECYTMLALIAASTRKVHFGPLVTNPAVRDITVTASALATLNVISGGRAECAIGRGDSSRRVLGRKPTTVERMMEAVEQIRTLAEGGHLDYDGVDTSFPWANPEQKLPIWIAGYGPRVLHAAGAHADGIVLQIAYPFLIQWFVEQTRKGAEEAGRDPTRIKFMSAAPVWVSKDKAQGRAQVRWFPAMVGNHVADLVVRYHGGELPGELTDYVEGRKGYDYHHHADKDADHLDFISDEIIEKFTILGAAEEHVTKLRELESIGVDQFVIYLMSGEEEATVRSYGSDIIPAFTGNKPAARRATVSRPAKKPARRAGARKKPEANRAGQAAKKTISRTPLQNRATARG